MANAVPWWASSLLSTLLALAVAAFAVSFDRRKTINQELVRKRIAVYEEIAPLLNDLYFFFYCYGGPLTLTPPETLERKAALDRLFQLYAPLFSESVDMQYYYLIDAMFDPIGGWNQPPRLKTSLDIFKLERPEWQPDWDRLFVPGASIASPERMHHYHALMDQFAVEIGARRLRAHWLVRWRKRRRGM